jgi:signal transduction histidine kinase
LDSEELSFQIQIIDPTQVLDQVERAFKPLAREKGVEISAEIQSDLPSVKLDPDRLTQILGNLINNALEVLPEGGKINVKALRDGTQLGLEIEDNGPGISDEDLPLIFDRSFRTDQSRTGNGSSGLGLAITRKLVEAQGGKISVSSIIGQGTRFKLHFPAV